MSGKKAAGGRRPASTTFKDVRFGGFRGPDGYVFELTGGHLCLDLANTRDDRPTSAPRELLGTFDDLVAWGVQSGAVTAPEGEELRRAATRAPREAERALRRARRLREVVFRVFSAVALGEAPPADDLDRLGAAAAGALGARRLTFVGEEASWAWPEASPPSLDRILWPALVSAAELLTSGDRGRVRLCEGDGCAWLFLDRSKNGSRRWCDMTVCGNRVKARRHYARTRRALTPPSA